jgi:hypothetical protein
MADRLTRQRDLDAVQPPGRGWAIRMAAISGLIHIVLTSGLITAEIYANRLRTAGSSA